MKLYTRLLSVCFLACVCNTSRATSSYHIHGSASICTMLDSTHRNAIQHVHQMLLDYYAMSTALTVGDTANTKLAAHLFLTALRVVDTSHLSTEERNLFTSTAPKLSVDVAKIQSSSSIFDMRNTFGEISEALITLVKHLKPNENQAVYYDYCPMKMKHWLSPTSEIANPYVGKAMRSCGNTEETIQ